jgi:thiol-disulfide isomerase/thioredoxin
MNKTLFLSIAFCFLSFTVLSQQGIDIKIKLRGYYYDTLWFGQTFGKRAVPEFSGTRNSQGVFELKSEKSIDPGFYAIIYKRASNANLQFIQCIVAEGQRSFTLETDLLEPYKNPVISGSTENVAFYRYLTDFQKMDVILDSVIIEHRLKKDEASFRARVRAEESMSAMQGQYLQLSNGTLLAGFVKRHQLHLPPPASNSINWKQEANHRWQWLRNHYFDNIILGGSDYMRYPQFIDCTDFFLFYLPPPHADTTKMLMDAVLGTLETQNPIAYEYYQKYLTNSLARMSQFQLDEVFVHMVRKYVLTGKAPWTTEEDMQRMRNEANMMEPLFAGKKAPNLTLQNRKGENISLYNIKAPAILLVFWMPDCSHCKKEMPILKRVNEKYKAAGLKVFSVCGKYREETKECWAFADENALPSDWYQLADINFQSRMSILYNIRSYPRLFILDSEKNIIMKRAGESSELELSSYINAVLPAKK